ncbi:MAG: hypothetical protein AAF725_21400, partial [Acidobacteriota bacterium]
PVKNYPALVFVLAILGLPSLLMAQPASPDNGSLEEQLSHLRALKPTAEALSAMSPDERRAAKAEWETLLRAEVARVGAEVSTEGGYRPLEESRPVKAVPRKLFGNITYDSGNVTGTSGVNSQMVGNRFDSAVNAAGTACCAPVPTSGSVTMITFDMVNTFFGSAVWSLYSNIMGTGADQVTSMARSGIMTGLNTLNVMSPTTANAYANGTFLAGIWQFDPTMTALGVDTGTTGGQGFHGISLNDGGMGSMLTTITAGGMGLNAVFRVSGDVVTPIELIDFKVED